MAALAGRGAWILLSFLLVLPPAVLSMRLEAKKEWTIGRHRKILNKTCNCERDEEGGVCDPGWKRGPIIVGGLSDAGEHGAKAILSEYLGVVMNGGREDQFDSPMINAAVGRHWKKIISMAHGVLTTEEFSKTPEFEVAADDLCKAVTNNWIEAGRPRHAWGFVSPRSVVVIPLWDHLFGKNWKFVHANRDPRAACRFYNNKIQYKEVCSHLMPYRGVCAYPQGCFRYWADVNFMAREFFVDHHKMSQYIYLPMERISINEDPDEFGTTFRFVSSQLIKLDMGITSRDVINILMMERKFATKYSPQQLKWFELLYLNDEFNKLTANQKIMKTATHMLGYQVSNFGADSNFDSDNSP